MPAATFEEVRDARSARFGQVAVGPRAVTLGDRAHALLPVFQRRVERALETIREAATLGRIGVAFSGGKDSTVLLDLVRQVMPAAPAAFYDSGCEYPWTYDLVEAYGVETVYPERPHLDMLRAGGYWGRVATEDPDLTFDFLRVLVQEPSERWRRQQELAVVAIGLRAQESKGRYLSAKRRGDLYQLTSGLWHLCPLAWWTDADVWAYIASRGLAYNDAYDRMAACGFERRSWRVSTLLGSSGAYTDQRYTTLRSIWPDGWAALVAEFPKIGHLT